MQAIETAAVSEINREILEQHLARALRHASRGMEHIARQESWVLKLDHNGRDPTEAQNLLSALRGTQPLHEREVVRLLKELSKQLH